MRLPEFLTTERGEKMLQFVKYCIVGVLNTLVTLGVIYICKSFLGWNLYLSRELVPVQQKLGVQVGRKLYARGSPLSCRISGLLSAPALGRMGHHSQEYHRTQ